MRQLNEDDGILDTNISDLCEETYDQWLKNNYDWLINNKLLLSNHIEEDEIELEIYKWIKIRVLKQLTATMNNLNYLPRIPDCELRMMISSIKEKRRMQKKTNVIDFVQERQKRALHQIPSLKF